MKLFLAIICVCASIALIYLSFKIIYAYTLIDRFHDESLKIVKKIKEKDNDIENIQEILSKYEKPINLTYKVFNKIHSFMR